MGTQSCWAGALRPGAGQGAGNPQPHSRSTSWSYSRPTGSCRWLHRPAGQQWGGTGLFRAAADDKVHVQSLSPEPATCVDFAVQYCGLAWGCACNAENEHRTHGCTCVQQGSGSLAQRGAENAAPPWQPPILTPWHPTEDDSGPCMPAAEDGSRSCGACLVARVNLGLCGVKVYAGKWLNAALRIASPRLLHKVLLINFGGMHCYNCLTPDSKRLMHEQATAAYADITCWCES